MIIALLALAFAMILGGLLTAFLGWDIVLVERGWTMVIAGSVSAAGGALLLGVAAAVSKLSQIVTQLSRLHADLSNGALAAALKASPDQSPAALPGIPAAGDALGESDRRTSDEIQPSLPLFADEKSGHRDGTHEGAAHPDDERASEPVRPLPPAISSDAASLHDEEETTLKVPDFLLADRARDTDAEPRVHEVTVARYPHEPEPHGADEQEDVVEPLEEPASEREPEPQTVDASADEEVMAADESFDDLRAPTVVGTYNSGDNKYVMFSDGSIEAQTPAGVFRFKSLDELKEFIAAGGEAPATTT